MYIVLRGTEIGDLDDLHQVCEGFNAVPASGWAALLYFAAVVGLFAFWGSSTRCPSVAPAFSEERHPGHIHPWVNPGEQTAADLRKWR